MKANRLERKKVQLGIRDDMTIYVENAKESTKKKLLEPPTNKLKAGEHLSG